MKRKIFIVVFLSFLYACSEQTKSPSRTIPSHIEAFNWPNNQVPSLGEIALGKRLFESEILSLSYEISCASCHIPSHAFSDTQAVSIGIHNQEGFRNTPTLYNLAWKPHFFMEGGVKSIERATLGPMLVEEEMSLQAPDLLKRFSEDKSWDIEFREVYGDSYEYRNVIDALAAYQRSLLSLDSKWDAVQLGEAEFTQVEKRGEALFFSDSLNCGTCHNPPFFTDFDFHDIGMPLAETIDYGRGRFTFDTIDFHAFSTPTLRNIELTAPYMHNGSVTNLDSVVSFYEHGGMRACEIEPFQISVEDKKALLAFLATLTGEEAKHNFGQ